MKKHINRRRFLKNTALATTGIVLVPNFISCQDDALNFISKISDEILQNLRVKNFNHGVGSFDPTDSQVLIWSRYNTNKPEVKITWQVATDKEFKNIIREGEVTTNANRDYTVSVEIQGLEADKKLFYRFININDYAKSVVGETITLPANNVDEIKFAVASCANYAAGLFNVYGAMAESDADIVIHLGDYIYEYGVNEYGTNAETLKLNRTPNPPHEIITLSDYRTRYKQYRSDKHLQLLHQKKPFIAVWDDHEITNDAYIDGAENHQKNEGDFNIRKQVALQAYSEYLPAKTNDINTIYRNFKVGNLVDLIMLDTRLVGRDKQLEYSNYIDASGNFDAVSFQKDWLNPNRTMLGSKQLNWLSATLASSAAKWQVLGQQVLMGRMNVPSELLVLLGKIISELKKTGKVSNGTNTAFQNQLKDLTQIKQRLLANDNTLTKEEKARVTNVLPYNLDAWDGYPIEREKLLAAFADKNVIVLAGDTHNSWHSNINLLTGEKVATELATSSVSSPGFETILGGNATTIQSFEQAIKILIDDLQFLNASKRGYLKVTFTNTGITSDWIYINTISDKNYNTSVGHTVVI